MSKTLGRDVPLGKMRDPFGVRRREGGLVAGFQGRLAMIRKAVGLQARQRSCHGHEDCKLKAREKIANDGAKPCGKDPSVSSAMLPSGHARRR